MVWCDNWSSGALAANFVFHIRTKHVEIDVHFIIEQIVVRVLEVQYVLSDREFQVAS